MVSAVSAVVSQAPTAAAERENSSYHWFKMPDLNRKTRRQIGKSGAGWTFDTICGLVHLVGRVGRPQAKKAARDLGRLGVGLKAIADESGQSPNKVRRDLVKLVDLGLVAVSRRNVTFKADLATGKIRENRTGRSLPVVVHLTIGPEHGRTKAGQEPAANPPILAPATPARMEPLPVSDRVHPGTPIQREEFKRRPDGDACGIGSPPASQEASLEAGDELATQEPPSAGIGRENACQSVLQPDGQGGATREDAGHEDLPPRIGRISRPAGKAASSRQAGRKSFPEDHREPVTWDGAAEAARQRMLAEMAKRREKDELDHQAHAAAGSLTPRQRAMSRRGG